jgi:hypothetical protein
MHIEGNTLRWEASTTPLTFTVTRHGADTIEATERGAEATAASTLSINRVNGEAIWTTRVSDAALPTLLRRCANTLTNEQCITEMEDISGGNRFACDPSPEQCIHYASGENALAHHRMTCNQQRF